MTRLAVGMDKPWTGDGFGDIMQKKPIWGLWLLILSLSSHIINFLLPQGTPKTPNNPKKYQETPRNPKEPQGTPRNSKELKGTSRNSKETLGEPWGSLGGALGEPLGSLGGALTEPCGSLVHTGPEALSSKKKVPWNRTNVFLHI